jgi:hypothetical protein
MGGAELGLSPPAIKLQPSNLKLQRRTKLQTPRQRGNVGESHEVAGYTAMEHCCGLESPRSDYSEAI